MDESPRKVEHAKAPGPERIWLSPCCDPERTWCQDAVFEVCECGAEPVAYLRADLAAPKTVAAASADPAADLALVAELRKRPWNDLTWEAAEAIERLLRERDGRTEVDRLFRAIKGMDIDDADKRAEHLMHQSIDGVMVGPGNRALIKAALAEHFAELIRERDAALRERDELMRRLNKENGSV